MYLNKKTQERKCRSDQIDYWPSYYGREFCFSSVARHLHAWRIRMWAIMCGNNKRKTAWSHFTVYIEMQNVQHDILYK